MTESGPREQISPSPPQRRGFLRSAWGWLVAPLAPAHDPAGRRKRLLAYLLIAIFFITVVLQLTILLADRPGSLRRHVYIPLMLVLQALFVLSYVLNRAQHYQWASGLAITAAVLGPWGSVALDPAVLEGDAMPLAYTAVSVILCSILASPIRTAVLAAIQMLALAALAIYAPQTPSIDWASLLTLVFATSVLSILSSTITRQDLEQIEHQTRQLLSREAGLRELSVRDHLTGLFNRRYLEETLDREIRRSARSHYMIGVLLLDVDLFKEINDQWGHAAGDVLLKRLGQVLATHIRGGDIACRWGGDEFVVMLPEASRQATRQRAERLREDISKLEIPYHGLSLGARTISIGLAMYPQHGASGEALLKSADQALYRAKAEGRNRVAVAELFNPPIA